MGQLKVDNMENKPLVSVIVPTHNVSKFIKETMLSILNQTYDNLEVIIIDDSSNDDTVEKVLEFKDPRIKIIKNTKNMGPAYSRNIGIKEATGDYIAFLDSDDIWDLTKTEKQLKFMVENDYKFSSCFYAFVDESGVSLKKYMSSPKRMTHKSFLKTDYIGCLTVMYKKEAYPKLSIPDDLKKRNDYALWIKLSEKADCYSLPMILASHRVRSGSVSSGSKFKLIKHHKELFQKLYGFGVFKSTIYAWRNGFYYIIRKLFFLKKIKCNN